MRYRSTNGQAPDVNFGEALMKGQAPDRGLYIPTRIPSLTADEIEAMTEMEYARIAQRVLTPYLSEDFTAEELRVMTESAYNYPIPVEMIDDRTAVLRLDQGPTASFKDFAARMMARLMQVYLKREKRRILILTATSGDTGSAVANAFYGLQNVQVLVLFPEKEVSERQRKQMTTLGGNVRVISLDGKFDDCQALVKQAFSDPDLVSLDLSSANSINIGRLLPQSVYYFYAWSRVKSRIDQRPIVVSVPCGNFGDLAGGWIARKMGLPISQFIAATNSNDEFPKFLNSGEYCKIEPSIACISSAMNVGHPSNLARLVDWYGGRMDEKGRIHRTPAMDQFRRDICSYSVSDDQTRQMIREAYTNRHVLLEPHGAVAWAGIQRYIKEQAQSVQEHNPFFISIETAHPAKFPDEIRHILQIAPELPESLSRLDHLPESMIPMANEYPAFKSYLLKTR
ncbi:MAG: threonine synthase [Candidatus Delongbacteria bacterium]|nr:threonine synthase [Candidatus Delongbacteria bacterium]